MVILDFGKKAENPVNEQFFYTKKDPNRAIHIREIEVRKISNSALCGYLCYFA